MAECDGAVHRDVPHTARDEVTEVKLTFAVPLALGHQLRALRVMVDHLLELCGVTSWRWEFDNGAVKEVLRGPFKHEAPEVFQVPLPTFQLTEEDRIQADSLKRLRRML